MQNLVIEGSSNTPSVNLDSVRHKGVIQGSSYPENVHSFYEPIVSWFEDYLLSHPESFILEIELIYFNSSSSKVYFDLFERLDEKNQHGVDIIVKWIYDKENETALEYGEEFAEDLTHLTFKIEEKV
jgi:hypothetical protein